MKNALFDDLKDLKKDMAEEKKRTSELHEKEQKEKKEKSLKADFESYMKDAGIKKI